MIAPGAGSSARALAQLERRGMWKRLVRIAFWSARTRFGAEDLVAETVARVLDPEDLPWDGAVPFHRFMTFQFRAVFKGWMRRMSAHEIPMPTEQLAEHAADAGPLPDERIDLRRTQKALFALGHRLLEELAESDPLARQCFDLYAAGMSTKDQAAALGCTEAQVQLLHAVIKRRAARIRDEHDLAERGRMSSLQAAVAAAKADRPSQGAKA